MPEEIGRGISGFKSSLVTTFLLFLMIPQLVKPINGLNYDLQELEKSKDYCFEHAARAEEAQNLVNDLIKSGLVNSTFYDWSCSKINEELKFEELMEASDCISKGRLSGCT